MKVAQISPTVFDRGSMIGGAERFVLELSRSLSRQVTTTLITFSSESKRVSVEWDGNLEMRRYPAMHFVRGNPANPITTAFLKSLRFFDCLHCHGYPNAVTDLSLVFAKALGKKLFVTDHHSGGVCASTYLLKIGVDTRRFIDGFLLLSSHSARQYGAFQARVRVIGGGVDANHFRPSDVVRAPGVLFVGRLISVKGVNYLIEAIDSETSLRIVGPAYDERYFRDLRAMARGKCITFVTAASEGELIQEYASALVTVVPSVYTDVYGRRTSGEVLGLVALESMACGTPVIATRCGGLAEVVEDGVTGFLVPPNDPAAIREKIRFFLDRPEIAREMGKAARERMRSEFTWDLVATRCLHAYREVLKS